MRRGEVWVANLNPTRGVETGKIRPVLVIQGDWLTGQGADTVAMVPLTTQHRPSADPLRTRISARGQLRADSYTMPERIRALDRSKFGRGPLTHLTEEEMAAVEKSLKAVLGLL